MAAASPAGLAIPEAIARSTRRRWNASGVALLIVPALVFVAMFYVYPLVNLLDASLRDPNAVGLSLTQYVSVLNSRRVIATLERTLRLSLLSTIITLLLSYPIALYLIGASRRIRTAILIVTFVSLAASLIVRNYGWLVVLSDAGPINQLLLALGIYETPVRMVYSEGAVLVAIVHYAMPFMILPIYGSLVRLQPSTWEAAQTLGASPWATLRTVVIPQTMPALWRRYAQLRDRDERLCDAAHARFAFNRLHLANRCGRTPNPAQFSARLGYHRHFDRMHLRHSRGLYAGRAADRAGPCFRRAPIAS